MGRGETETDMWGEGDGERVCHGGNACKTVRGVPEDADYVLNL